MEFKNKYASPEDQGELRALKNTSVWKLSALAQQHPLVVSKSVASRAVKVSRVGERSLRVPLCWPFLEAVSADWHFHPNTAKWSCQPSREQSSEGAVEAYQPVKTACGTNVRGHKCSRTTGTLSTVLQCSTAREKVTAQPALNTLVSKVDSSATLK